MARGKDSRQVESADQAWEESWADLREAIARGEITREELLGSFDAAPIRLSIGDQALEVNLSATVRESPPAAAQPAKPAGVLAFPARRR